MKLTHPLLEQRIEFEDNKVNLMVVENPILFRNLIKEISLQIEGEPGQFILSDSKREYSMKKKMTILFSPFELDVNNSKIMTKTVNCLKEAAQDMEMILEKQQISREISAYLLKLRDLCDLNLCFSEEAELGYLIKSMGPYYSNNQTELIEVILSYTDLYASLFANEIFVLVNFKSYLDQTEVIELYKEAAYKKINLLLLENKEYPHLDGETQILIDQDLCEI